jgi:VWFA-related protein
MQHGQTRPKVPRQITDASIAVATCVMENVVLVRERWLEYLILPLFLAAALQSQTSAPNSTEIGTTLKSNVRLVAVDVVVTDRNGRPVQGLHKETFLLDEDGHAQKITSFEEHAGTQSAPAPANLPDLPPNVFINIPRVKATDAVTVLLFDALNTALPDQDFVRSQMFKYLKDPVPGRRMAIFTLGTRLRLIQGFTDDPAMLAAALKNLNRGAGPQLSPALPTKSETETDQKAVAQILDVPGIPSPQARQAALALQGFQAEQTTAKEDLRVNMTLDAFQQLARYLAGIPGRKNLVWFSSAFPLVLFRDLKQLTIEEGHLGGQRDYSERVRKTDALLAQAQVAVYPLAAGGVAVGSLDDAELAPHGQAAVKAAQGTAQYDDLMQRVAFVAMEAIAEETGGRAFYTNGLSEALAEVAANGSNYYTLSYTPTNEASDGRFRKIQVKLASGSYKLAYRRGYYADDAKADRAAASKPPGDPLQPFMGPGMPDSTEIPLALRVKAGPVSLVSQPVRAGDNDKLDKLTGPLTRYTLDVVAAASGVRLETSANGTHHGKLEAALVAYDEEGQLLNWSVRQLDLDLDTTHYAREQENGVNFQLEIDVPKSAVYIRTGVYDVASGKAGTLEVPLSAPVIAASSASNPPAPPAKPN